MAFDIDSTWFRGISNMLDIVNIITVEILSSSIMLRLAAGCIVFRL